VVKEKERWQERARTRRRVTRRCDRVRSSDENYEYHNDRSCNGKNALAPQWTIPDRKSTMISKEEEEKQQNQSEPHTRI
jgi:hypothetical protein